MSFSSRSSFLIKFYFFFFFDYKQYYCTKVVYWNEGRCNNTHYTCVFTQIKLWKTARRRYAFFSRTKALLCARKLSKKNNILRVRAYTDLFYKKGCLALTFWNSMCKNIFEIYLCSVSVQSCVQPQQSSAQSSNVLHFFDVHYCLALSVFTLSDTPYVIGL